ncbi:MAG: SUMF1/EgtB/PvdO family nonheme iron enzyme, partial [Paludibacteraceae bacterium]|nr:SUMF1/EgtB/PvdO family nonheme iron enzyme [Paludibacteraceae bacterium]
AIQKTNTKQGDKSSGSNRVNRGGSWNNNASNCRVANRNNNSPGNRNNNLGFRVVLLRSLSQGRMSCNKQICHLSALADKMSGRVPPKNRYW